MFVFNLLSAGNSLWFWFTLIHCCWLVFLIRVVTQLVKNKKPPLIFFFDLFLLSTGASTEADKTIDCDVSYLSQLWLRCPSKSGIWAKQSATNASMSEVVCNCSRGQCILNPDRTLHNEDSGLYFCQDAFNYRYVNINVLGSSKTTLGNTACIYYKLPLQGVSNYSETIICC